MENESVRFETGANAPKGDPLSFIITDMAQNEHLRESGDLAATIQAGLGAVHPGPSRGVQQANFAVLRGSYMPAVLVEIGFGMNAVGLANPGVKAVAEIHLPWLAKSLKKAKVIVNVVGSTPREFGDVIAALDDVGGADGYELNVSCPNVEAGGLEFGADPAALT